jgi:hypothetical protein
MSGHGKITLSNGVTYEGNWENGAWNGQGTLIYQSGTYTGNFVNGLQSGMGVLMLIDGTAFEGIFEDNQIKRGKKIYNNGNSYKGELLNYEANGRGIMNYCDGSVHDGNFVDAQLTEGTIKFPDGTIYKGVFENGKIKEGEISYSNKDCFKGTWNDIGEFTGTVSKNYPDGAIYNGELKTKLIMHNNQPLFEELKQGKGKIIYNDDESGGYYYDGYWDKNQYHGKGLIVYLDEDHDWLGEYDGNWRNGKKHGEGIEKKISNGLTTIYDGTWKNDDFRKGTIITQDSDNKILSEQKINSLKRASANEGGSESDVSEPSEKKQKNDDPSSSPSSLDSQSFNNSPNQTSPKI